MESIDFDQVKKRSIKGILTLSGRTVILQAINFIGYFFVTIFLERSEFGLFILVSVMVDILGYFSDIGLAAALVQKKEEPTIKEVRSTFTIQQILVLSMIVILLTLSPLLKRFYHFDKEGMILLYSFTFAFFLSSLKTIPTVLLERKLQFTKVIIPQFIETISFNLIVVLLAWKGLGVRSYALAVLVRGFLGTLTLYLIAPWKIGLHFSFRILKKLLHFGVPYQLNTLLAVVKDKFMILLLGKMIGSEGIALVGWAEKWATMPLRYFLDNTVKVAFPTFSRLQYDKRKLKVATEKVLYFLVFLILPALVGVGLIAQPLVKVIPRYIKWQPALIPLYLYCLASVFGSLAVFLTTIFNAIGKIKVTFKLMIFWTILTWIFTPLLALKFNYQGVPVAVFLVNFTSLIGIFLVKKYVRIDLLSCFKGPFFACLLMIVGVMIIKKYIALTLAGILLIILAGITIYIGTMMIVDKEKIMKETKFLANEFIKRNQ